MTDITPIYIYPEYSRTADAALLREAIQFSQWSVGGRRDQGYYVEAFEPGLPGVVPFGTVENVHGHIEKYTDRKPPPPMNVPGCLFEFAAPGIRHVEGPVPKGLLPEFFAKSRDVIKRPSNGIRTSLPEGNWEIKDVRDYEVEYRAFYWRGELVDVRRYSGDPIAARWGLNDHAHYFKRISMELNSNRETLPPALTVDTGVASEFKGAVDGKWIARPEVIECHHFYACGLYGMDAPDKLLLMTSGWWKWFLKNGECGG